MRLIDINVRDGEISLQQYDSLKRLFSSEKAGTVELFKGVGRILLKREITSEDLDREYIDAVYNTWEAMDYWREMESKYLAYKPTQEETAAGLEKYSEQVGVLGTAKALAKAYHTDPDTVLDEWTWAKVFQILRTDLLESKYRKRLEDIQQRKYRKR